MDGGDKPHFHTKIACISVLMQAMCSVSLCLKSLNHDRLTSPIYTFRY